MWHQIGEYQVCRHAFGLGVHFVAVQVAAHPTGATVDIAALFGRAKLVGAVFDQAVQLLAVGPGDGHFDRRRERVGTLEDRLGVEDNHHNRAVVQVGVKVPPLEVTGAGVGPQPVLPDFRLRGQPFGLGRVRPNFSEDMLCHVWLLSAPGWRLQD
jgi:hypothetical protein